MQMQTHNLLHRGNKQNAPVQDGNNVMVGSVVQVAVQDKEDVGLVVVAGELVAIELIQSSSKRVHQQLQEQGHKTDV